MQGRVSGLRLGSKTDKYNLVRFAVLIGYKQVKNIRGCLPRGLEKFENETDLHPYLHISMHSEVLHMCMISICYLKYMQVQHHELVR